MKIAVDGYKAYLGYRGIAHYTRSIIRALASRYGQVDTVHVYGPAAAIDASPVLFPPTVQVHPTPGSNRLPGSTLPDRVHWEQELLAVALEQDKPDVLLAPSFSFPIQWAGPTVAVVHDLAFEYAEDFNRESSLSFYRTWARRCAAAASHLIASSYATRKDIERFWGMSGKTTVAYLAPDCPSAQDSDRSLADLVRHHLDIPAGYLLYLGASHPRKNLPLLIAAYEAALETTELPPLLLVTDVTPDLSERVSKLVADGRVVIRPFCPPSMLPYVYSSATALVYPSLLEGFGLVPLEAMAAGAPVACSRIPALVEVLGSSAEYFDPKDVDDVARALRVVLCQGPRRECLTDQGRRQIQLYSWEQTAQVTRMVLHAAACNSGT